MTTAAPKLGAELHRASITLFVTLQAAEDFHDRLSARYRGLLSVDGVESARRVLTGLLLLSHRVQGSATKVRLRDRELDISAIVSAEPPLLVVRACEVLERGGASGGRRIVNSAR